MSKAEQAHKPRLGTCKVCKAKYPRVRAFQKVCSTDCAQVFGAIKAKADKLKAERLQDKAKREEQNTKGELQAEAQRAFNEYIRARDYGKPCISCQRPIAWGQGSTGGVCDAGHWLSVGARVNLRFNEDNVHAQCKHCNKQLSGNAANYRIGLVERIGIERVEILERDQCVRKYTKEGLRELAAQYRELTRQLKRSAA